MNPSRDEVVRDTLRFLQERADEQGEDVELSEDTYMLGDMNWSSLEIVVMANTAQQQYRQLFPFEDLFAGIAAKEHKDITVGEWADFLCEHLGKGPAFDPEELAAAWELDPSD